LFGNTGSLVVGTKSRREHTIRGNATLLFLICEETGHKMFPHFKCNRKEILNHLLIISIGFQRMLCNASG